MINLRPRADQKSRRVNCTRVPAPATTKMDYKEVVTFVLKYLEEHRVVGSDVVDNLRAKAYKEECYVWMQSLRDSVPSPTYMEIKTLYEEHRANLHGSVKVNEAVIFALHFLKERSVVGERVIRDLRSKATQLECPAWMKYCRGSVSPKTYKELNSHYEEHNKADLGFSPMNDKEVADMDRFYADSFST